MSEEKKIIISGITSDLLGFGYIENKRYRFRYATIDDELIFTEKGKGRKKYNIIKEFIKESPRDLVKCKYFTKCGGCIAQHIPYQEQFFFKTKELAETYRYKYGIEAELIPAKLHYNQRNRMDFGIFPNAIGLHAAGNFRSIIDLDKCEIQSDWANEELLKVRNLIGKFPELVFHRKNDTGFIKYVTLRYGVWTKDTMTIFTCAADFEGKEIENEFEQAAKEICSANNIIICYNRRKSEASAEGKHRTIKGNYFYRENIMGYNFEIPFNSFFQPNPIGFMPILEYINSQINQYNTNKLIDLFCGNGFFSALYGKHFTDIYGYDYTDSAVNMANSRIKDLYPDKNIFFESRNLFQKTSLEFSKEIFDENSLIIMDPPRSGIGHYLAQFLQNVNSKYIFYVSCNPHSQLEDLKILTSRYKIKSIMITDPYPQTSHLESVVLLTQLR